MRIWSLNPRYLDAKGLVALWRETLLAKNILLGNTKGYINHPQLIRFKNHQNPVEAINHYLLHVFEEAKNRGYNFDRKKFEIKNGTIEKISVTSSQVKYEFQHLQSKLKTRDILKYQSNRNIPESISLHPIFYVVEGEVEVESWEVII